MNKIVEVTDLKKHFGQTRAVDGVTFDVRSGEIFGIIGPDAAGKTTTLRILSGIMDQTSGRCSVLGNELPKKAEEVKKNIGYMSQKFNLYPDLTVEENIEFFSDIFLTDRKTLSKRIEPLLRMTRLSDFTKRLAGNLSGGMKQKLALICTLIHRPKLLILDEPTTGVDPVSRREFWEILHEILLEGVTVLICTPYMDEAEWCTRVALMHNGKVLAVDTPPGLKKGLARSEKHLKEQVSIEDVFMSSIET
ncbi:MAG: ABC transporter ATP-binding protein [Endomicrobiales bacterium]|nr:ABC transporter ATP-binding protein [Endomicrobiales bacterium]